MDAKGGVRLVWSPNASRRRQGQGASAKTLPSPEPRPFLSTVDDHAGWEGRQALACFVCCWRVKHTPLKHRSSRTGDCEETRKLRSFREMLRTKTVSSRHPGTNVLLRPITWRRRLMMTSAVFLWKHPPPPLPGWSVFSCALNKFYPSYGMMSVFPPGHSDNLGPREGLVSIDQRERTPEKGFYTKVRFLGTGSCRSDESLLLLPSTTTWRLRRLEKIKV